MKAGHKGDSDEEESEKARHGGTLNSEEGEEKRKGVMSRGR